MYVELKMILEEWIAASVKLYSGVGLKGLMTDHKIRHCQMFLKKKNSADGLVQTTTLKDLWAVLNSTVLFHFDLQVYTPLKQTILTGFQLSHLRSLLLWVPVRVSVESSLVAPGGKEQQFPPEKKATSKTDLPLARGFVSSSSFSFTLRVKAPPLSPTPSEKKLIFLQQGHNVITAPISSLKRWTTLWHQASCKVKWY